MPWQQLVADVGGELDPTTGLPAYREVIFTVPRQSGKTTLILAWELQRALGWGSPQRIIYSAQSGKDAREKLMEDQAPILERHRRALGIRKITKGVGYESVRFDNGSLIKLLASSEESGHGKTLDLAIKDEYFADEDDRRDQALVPAMTTKAAAQMVTATTAGTDRSIPWNRRQQLGRQFVEEGRTDGIAYFEWSADPDLWDPADEDAWWEFMPALGYEIALPSIRHARDTLTEEEFRRAYGNISNQANRKADLIPADRWEACAVKTHQPTGPLAYALDVDTNAQGEEWCSIAVSDGIHGEIVNPPDAGRGTDWVVPLCVARKDRFSEIAIDPSGPAGKLIKPLEDAGITVRQVKPAEFVQASGQFLDKVTSGTFRHIDQPALNRAVAGAAKRDVGDGAWRFSRTKSSVDISPLVAAMLAAAMVGEPDGGDFLW